MKSGALFVVFTIITSFPAEGTPKVFDGLFSKDEPVMGQVCEMIRAPEVEKYLAKIEAAKSKDPKWLIEYSKKTKPGTPLQYDEHMGLTKEEYAQYLTVRNKTELRRIV